jgi:hypothetical protein
VPEERRPGENAPEVNHDRRPAPEMPAPGVKPGRDIPSVPPPGPEEPAMPPETPDAPAGPEAPGR